MPSLTRGYLFLEIWPLCFTYLLYLHYDNDHTDLTCNVDWIVDLLLTLKEEMGGDVKKILKAKSNFTKDPPGAMSSRAAFPPLSSDEKGCDDIALRTKFFPPFSRLPLPLKSFQSQIADAR